MLSLDVANDSIYGDLTNEAANSLWQRLVREGRVRGVLGGPPCETWSRARHLPPNECRQRPPRPL
eukprot:5088769-Pyramimonas_sp.AAC.1